MMIVYRVTEEVRVQVSSPHVLQNFLNLITDYFKKASQTKNTHMLRKLLLSDPLFPSSSM
jgi:hypothetical protein